MYDKCKSEPADMFRNLAEASSLFLMRRPYHYHTTTIFRASSEGSSRYGNPKSPSSAILIICKFDDMCTAATSQCFVRRVALLAFRIRSFFVTRSRSFMNLCSFFGAVCESRVPDSRNSVVESYKVRNKILVITVTKRSGLVNPWL